MLEVAILGGGLRKIWLQVHYYHLLKIVFVGKGYLLSLFRKARLLLWHLA